MPARNAVVVVGTTWTAVSDGAVSTVTLLQNWSSYYVEMRFAETQPAADARPNIVWPPLSAEFNLSVPNGPLTVWARSPVSSAELSVIHA